MKATPLTLDEYFAGWPRSRRLFDLLSQELAEIGPAQVRVSKSQVAFYRKRAFAWAWIPGKYLGGETAPLVLSVRLSQQDASPRWKQVIQPTPGRFMHHLELWSAEAIDGEVRAWLEEVWRQAG